MRKPIFLSLGILFITLLGFEKASSQVTERYSRVKVYANKAQVKSLHSKGVAFDEMAEKNDAYFIGDFSAKEIALMEADRLRIEFLINDLTEDFLKKNKEAAVAANEALRSGGTPPGFSYGSMGGYLTYSEMAAELDELKSMYPNLITTKSSIGTTAEGRDLWMVKISDDPDSDNPFEEGVFYGGLYHAREPISMVNLIYFMQYILSQYGTDPEITCLIDNRELYFVPCVNPDGYVYNQTTNPNGGGFWRKNRRNNGGGVFGVDLNRNFSYNWAHDNDGSSPTPSAEDYRGPSAASEPEVAAVQNFISSNQLTVALNHHTYSNKVIFPFEYNSSQTPNETHYNTLGNMLISENGFQFGKQFPLMGYNANGTADDWIHGANGIFSFTPEVGDPQDGFWPVQSKIISICEKSLDMNITAAWSSGNYIKPTTPANNFVSGLSYDLPITVTNLGSLLTLETVTMSINDPRVLLYNGLPIVLTGLPTDGILMALRNITFVPGAASGPLNGNLIVSTLEGCTYSVPFTFQYSQNGCFPISSSWTAVDIGNPGLAGSSCYENGVYTIKGSGTGGLATTSDKCHMMKLTANTDVWEIKVRVASVQNTGASARAGISIAESSAAGSKRVTLLVNPSANRLEFQKRTSTNGSVSSTNVNNQGTAPKWLKIVKSSGGNYYGYYSNNGTSWTQIGKHKMSFPTNVTAGIMVTSGSSLLLNTATFDNLAVSTPGGTINRSSESTNPEFEGIQNKMDKIAIYPNPSKGFIEVRLPASSPEQMISVFNINGKEVHKEVIGATFRRLDLSNLANGLYFIRYKEGTKVQYEKFIINK